MTEAQMIEQILALRRRGGVSGDGPPVEVIRSWVAAARSDAIRDEVETILQGPGWVVGATALEYALAGSDNDRSLQKVHMPDPNVVAHVNYRRRRLSVEHLAASAGAVVQVVVQFPPPPTPPGRLREALHAALGHGEPRQRIPALLAVLSLSGDVTIQLSILDAAIRAARRLDGDQRGQWLSVIAQAEYRVLHQTGQWVRYGLLTETQREGGVAFFAAETWLGTIEPGEQGTVQVGCHVLEADHPWNLAALHDSLDEISEVDACSADCWRDWLERSLPPALQSEQDDLLRRLGE